jgi:hypothetical protein
MESSWFARALLKSREEVTYNVLLMRSSPSFYFPYSLNVACYLYSSVDVYSLGDRVVSRLGIKSNYSCSMWVSATSIKVGLVSTLYAIMMLSVLLKWAVLGSRFDSSFS